MTSADSFVSMIEMDLPTVLIAAFAQTIFVIAWSMTRWWGSPTGRAFWFKSATLALWLDTSIVSLYFDWPHENLTKVIIYRVLTAGIILQLLAFLWKRHGIKQEIALASYRGDHVA